MGSAMTKGDITGERTSEFEMVENWWQDGGVKIGAAGDGSVLMMGMNARDSGPRAWTVCPTPVCDSLGLVPAAIVGVYWTSGKLTLSSPKAVLSTPFK